MSEINKYVHLHGMSWLIILHVSLHGSETWPLTLRGKINADEK